MIFSLPIICFAALIGFGEEVREDDEVGKGEEGDVDTGLAVLEAEVVEILKEDLNVFIFFFQSTQVLSFFFNSFYFFNKIELDKMEINRRVAIT